MMVGNYRIHINLAARTWSLHNLTNRLRNSGWLSKRSCNRFAPPSAQRWKLVCFHRRRSTSMSAMGWFRMIRPGLQALPSCSGRGASLRKQVGDTSKNLVAMVFLVRASTVGITKSSASFWEKPSLTVYMIMSPLLVEGERYANGACSKQIGKSRVSEAWL